MADSNRRLIIKSAAASAILATQSVFAQTVNKPNPVRIGYTTPRSGAWTVGAQTIQEPVYLFWADTINEAGGLDVQGVKRLIEFVALDDNSELDSCIRHYDNLMNNEKVDLILPPWGNVANINVAQLANRYQYPILHTSVFSQKIVDLNLPFVFTVTPQPKVMASALVSYLVDSGVKNIAVVYNDDLYSLENYANFKLALNKSKIKIVKDGSISSNGSNTIKVIKDIQQTQPDAFIAFADYYSNLSIVNESKSLKFNPSLFYLGSHSSYPNFAKLIGNNVEGILGMSILSKKNPNAKKFFEDFIGKQGKEADTFFAVSTFASLEILQASVKKVGLNRAALRDYISTNTHKTIMGEVKFSNNYNTSTPGTVSQWQNNELEVIWPKDKKTADSINKSNWK